ncbi:MAG: hypothetical protein HY929_08865 [Euryarchaeota archaeon]|nr:hypothetical protein [Euryarchaeota archaeon]
MGKGTIAAIIIVVLIIAGGGAWVASGSYYKLELQKKDTKISELDTTVASLRATLAKPPTDITPAICELCHGDLKPVHPAVEKETCRKCHGSDYHAIHSGKPVSCPNCHGALAQMEKSPRCDKCHLESLPNIHKTKGCVCHGTAADIHAKFFKRT